MDAHYVEKAKILVVDDVELNRIILQEILSDTYEIEQASSGVEAISIMLNAVEKPTLVLLDIMMPEMDGYEVLSIMKASPTLEKIPVIFITAVTDSDSEERGLSGGAADYITKPFEPDIIKLRVSNQIELTLYREKLENMVEVKANELVSIKEHYLNAMANLIEYRSLESGQHVLRTKKLAGVLVAQLIKMGTYSLELLESNYTMLINAVPLHDIGKIGIPDAILLKPGRLTPEEFKVIENHTIIGGNVIKSLMRNDDEDDYLKHCYNICRFHHERWDGSGYPDKLSGLDIPLAARIVSIVDVYDALVNERCYKKPMTHDESMEIISKSSGSHFDPKVVMAMLEVQEQLKQFSNL